MSARVMRCWAPDGKSAISWLTGSGDGVPETWAAPGMFHVYYPEMGEKPDLSKLFQRASHVGRYTYVDISTERETEARAVFKRLRVRPVIDRVELRNGGSKLRAQLTSIAWERIRDEGDVSAEALL